MEDQLEPQHPPPAVAAPRPRLTRKQLAALLVSLAVGVLLAGTLTLFAPMGFLSLAGCGGDPACEAEVTRIVVVWWVSPPVLLLTGLVGTVVARRFRVRLAFALLPAVGTVAVAVVPFPAVFLPLEWFYPERFSLPSFLYDL